jgi:hypothetical protein
VLLETVHTFSEEAEKPEKERNGICEKVVVTVLVNLQLEL